jgi:hypothetical protein
MKTVVATMIVRSFNRSVSDPSVVTLDVTSENGLQGRMELYLSCTASMDDWVTIEEVELPKLKPDDQEYRYPKCIPKRFRVVLDVPDNFPTYP